MLAASSYIPAPYEGKVVIIQAENNDKSFESQWRAVLSNVKFHIVPGTHYTVLGFPYNKVNTCFFVQILIHFQQEVARIIKDSIYSKQT